MTATVRKGKARITWRADPAASSYRVRISKPGAKKSTTQHVFTAKVRKGVKYRFQVAGQGPGGIGPNTTIRFNGK